jgi:hypothetical protein
MLTYGTTFRASDVACPHQAVRSGGPSTSPAGRFGIAWRVTLVAAVGAFMIAACGESNPSLGGNRSASDVPIARGDAVADLPSATVYPDPLQWVFAYCMADQRAASSSPDSMDSHAMAFRACRDFMFRLPEDQQRYYTCLNSHGVDADPRMPPVEVPDAAIERADAACKSMRPAFNPAPTTPDLAAWIDCLSRHNLAIDATGKPNYDAARGAALACQSFAPIFSDG